MMNDRDRKQASESSDSRVSELTVALDKAEKKLAQRELLITAAIGQTETARAQYEQANSRAETLRKQLDTKEEQVSALQKELQLRDDRIATLEQIGAESDSAMNALNKEAKQLSSASESDDLAAMGLVMESLDQPITRYKIDSTTTTIGRAPTNDIAIHHHSVSRYHARMVVEPEGVFLIDLQSTNGCKVNGQRIARQMIGHDDTISVGSAKFRFSIRAIADFQEMARETHTLLEDSVVFVPASKSKSHTTQ
jgi:hypothetical protein